MLGKLPNQHQRNLFSPSLTDFINMSHELVLLSDKIDWSYFEKSFEGYYSNTGQPSMPIRLMVSALMLKRIDNLSDEKFCEKWERDPYLQYFSGMAHFTHKFPCDPSDFVHFRKRIGEAGVQKIFAYSVQLFGSETKEEIQLSDTTVGENNITFPTDAKLAKKIIDKCNKIAQKEGIKQRQTYVRRAKQLVRDTHNRKHPKRMKKAKKADAKLKTIAGRLIRELERNFSKELLAHYQEELNFYQKVLAQQRTDKNKIYSLHKPFTACIAKGKAHTQYEFGNKIGLTVTFNSQIITSIKSFLGNPHDSKTIEPLLAQMQENINYQPKEIVYDRGGRGAKKIGETIVSTPDNRPLKRDSAYQKRKKRKKFRKRAAIEPIIGHLKSDYRLGQNYLHGTESSQINAFLAAAGWNLKKFMKRLKEQHKKLFFLVFSSIPNPKYRCYILCS